MTAKKSLGYGDYLSFEHLCKWAGASVVIFHDKDAV